MNREKQIEEIELTEVDILTNDLNQHCADLAETFCGNTNCLTCLAHALIAKGYRKAAEVAREMFADFQSILFSIMYFGNDGKYHLRKMNADRVTKIFERYYNIKNKYT